MNIPEFSTRSITAESIEGIEGAVGQLIIGFAYIDQALDFLLIELFPIAVKRNIASKMPYQLGQKIELIVKCADRIKELAEVKAELQSLLKQVSDYSWVRNTLAHGALSHYREEPPSAFVFAKLSYDKQKGVHMHRDEVIATAAIVQAAYLANKTIVPLHNVVQRIQGIRFA